MSDLIEYINELFGIKSATSAPIVITLLVFVTGQMLIFLTASVKEIAKRKRIRKVYNEIVNSAIISTRKQEKIFLEHSSFMNFENLSNLILKKMEFFQLGLLQEIGFNNSHSSFFNGIENWLKTRNRKTRSRAFVKCWEIMKSVDYWITESYNSIESFSIKYNWHNDARNESLMKLGKQIEDLLFSHIGKDVDPNTKLGSYLWKLLEINRNHRRANDLRPHSVHRNLVVQLRILNRKYPELNEISEMNFLLIEASIHYEGMFEMLKKQRLQYSIFARNFRYNYRIFEKSLKVLNAKC